MKKAIGLVIKAFRKYLNYKQEYIASQLNVTVATLANIENGRVGIDIEKLYQLSLILGVQVKDMVTLAAEIFEKGNDVGINSAVKYLSPRI